MKEAYTLAVDTALNIKDAVTKVYAFPAPKFSQSIDLTIQIPNRSAKDKDSIKGFAVLPHGTGKSHKIAIFAAESEQVTGADKLITADLDASDFKARMSQYHKCGATTAGLPTAIKAASVIGPMGLMPTAKNGTVMPDVTRLIDFLQNAVIFAEKGKHIMVSVGTMSMPTDHTIKNIEYVLEKVFAAVNKDKRSIFGKIYVSATMSPAVLIQYP